MESIQFVREQLAARKGEWIHIAKASGVSYRALCNVMHDRTDPRISTVAKLADWFRANPRIDVAA
jgi:hypothetical protein